MNSGSRVRILNALLILTSLIGYLEWGKGNSSFLFQTEWEILSKIASDPISILHPFTVLPIAGQILLLITVFQNAPSKQLTYFGIACLSLLLLMMFGIGLMSLNLKIVGSTIPFMAVAFLAIRQLRKESDKSV